MNLVSNFTCKLRGTETNLDDFPARYYSSSQGRWLNPDWSVTPEPVPYIKLEDPQTLNLYAYVGNDPTNHADADGHEGASPPEDTSSGQSDSVSGSDKTAQDTSAAAVAPVTIAPLVIDKIIVTVEAAAEKGFDISLGAIGGTIGFIFASSPKTATEDQDTIHTGTEK